jgi:antitoxin ParD1/3/4
MPTRNVVLTKHQTDMIERLVGEGRYQNASEVLREGLRLLEQRDAEDEARLAALRAAAQIGLDDFTAGRYRSFDTEEALHRHVMTLSEGALEQPEDCAAAGSVQEATPRR